MKLSVIVPVYNVEPYIRRCLDSLINQTYRNLEIILVDDGSTDRSGLICDEYALIDKRIRVIHKENGGVFSARRTGIMYATGEYTTNMDSDDWIEEQAYEKIVDRIKEYQPEMLVLGYKKEYAGYVEEYRQKIRAGFFQKEEFWEEFNRCVNEMPFFTQPVDMILCNKAIKTELLRKYQIGCEVDLGDNGDDDGVVFPCLLGIESIFIETECFYHYCVRKKSVLWEPVNRSYESCLLLFQHLITSYVNHKNSVKMDKNFLIYKLFYHLILVVPYKFINKDGCVFYPRLKPESKIIVYGKGVFANRLIEYIIRFHYCSIVDNIDKADICKLKAIDESQYDYIVLAIFHSVIVSSSLELIIKHGVKQDKILCIEKEDLIWGGLPQEVQNMMQEI